MNCKQCLKEFTPPAEWDELICSGCGALIRRKFLRNAGGVFGEALQIMSARLAILENMSIKEKCEMTVKLRGVRYLDPLEVFKNFEKLFPNRGTNKKLIDDLQKIFSEAYGFKIPYTAIGYARAFCDITLFEAHLDSFLIDYIKQDTAA